MHLPLTWDVSLPSYQLLKASVRDGINTGMTRREKFTKRSEMPTRFDTPQFCLSSEMGVLSNRRNISRSAVVFGLVAM